eukprot:GHVR01127807.1.p1 GENE.GHVR01127807.1~~GHVR01127807.1.p1  ORF type:complete len:168 (+),score=12.04 GHVR01127807.1:98-601(+)
MNLNVHTRSMTNNIRNNGNGNGSTQDDGTHIRNLAESVTGTPGTLGTAGTTNPLLVPPPTNNGDTHTYTHQQASQGTDATHRNGSTLPVQRTEADADRLRRQHQDVIDREALNEDQKMDEFINQITNRVSSQLNTQLTSSFTPLFTTLHNNQTHLSKTLESVVSEML